MATESSSPSRGEVWLVRFGAGEPGEPGKNRPAIIVSSDALASGSARDLFVVVPVSASAARSHLRPGIEPEATGVDRASVAIPAAVRSVARPRLLRRVGQVQPATLEAVGDALTVILGLE